MAEYKVTIRWTLGSGEFLKGRFSREHTWTFDGGATVPASASPGVVPAPYSNPAGVDPEEAFVAAIASCHMMTYLHVASRAGFVVERYDDEAVGVLRKNERGAIWVAAVTLHPRIAYGADEHPTTEDEHRLHELAHEQCFIANSVKTGIMVEPPAR